LPDASVPRFLQAPMMARWLLLPVAFVALEWTLYVAPDAVTRNVPALWSTARSNVVVLRKPRTRVQSLELGYHAARYESCMASYLGSDCSAHLEAASNIVGTTLNATYFSLDNLRAELLLEDEERSIAQRILGLFSFVNLIWLVSIIGALLTVGPFILYVLGAHLAKIATMLYEHVVVPLHKAGLFELLAYALAFLVTAQSCRYPMQHASAATLVGLSGALAFAPCWAYSTALWAEASTGKEEHFAALTGTLLALCLVPLTLIHASSLIGFMAVAAAYCALGFVMGPFLGGFYIGFRSFDAVMRCWLVSALLVVAFATLQIRNLLTARLSPFARGAMVLGNVGFFLALLLLSSEWRGRKSGLSYGAANTLMLASLVAAALVGSVFAMPSCVNTASTFFVLWVMEKEMEAKWGAAGIAVLFANFVALYFLAHHLHTHPEVITSLFDPSGLYA